MISRITIADLDTRIAADPAQNIPFAYRRAVEGAKALAELEAAVADWAPLVPEAVAIVGRMGPAAVDAFRHGLALDRTRALPASHYRRWGIWLLEFGDLVYPPLLIELINHAVWEGRTTGEAYVLLRRTGRLVERDGVLELVSVAPEECVPCPGG